MMNRMSAYRKLYLVCNSSSCSELKAQCATEWWRVECAPAPVQGIVLPRMCAGSCCALPRTSSHARRQHPLHTTVAHTNPHTGNRLVPPTL